MAKFHLSLGLICAVLAIPAGSLLLSAIGLSNVVIGVCNLKIK